MMKGKVKLLTYSGLDIAGCGSCDFEKQIEEGAKPSKIVTKCNVVQTGWAGNIASALCNKSYDWTGTSLQLAFDSNWGGSSSMKILCTDDISTVHGIGEKAAGSMNPVPTCISMKTSTPTNKWAVLDMVAEVSKPTTTSIRATAYWYGVTVTVDKFYLGLLHQWDHENSYSLPQNFMLTTAAISSSFSQVLDEHDVTKVVWDIALSDL